MDAVAIHPTQKTPRAVLACLAWALLLGVVRADEASPPEGNGTRLVAASEQILEDVPEVQPIPPQQPPGMLGTTLSPPERVIVDTETWPPPQQWPTAAPESASPTRPPARQSDQWPIWRCLPQGMVPYIGPRTPDAEKDRGLGMPLGKNGWRSQLFSTTVFAGATDGGALMPGRVNQQPSFYGGLNFGWDYDHYWGIEKRLGFGALNLTNGAGQPISQTGLSITGEYRLMYYPLGDARWRPFLTAGVGWSDFYFNDDRGVSHLDTVGMIPFGFGLKYLYTDRIAFRTDLIDEMTFGNGLLTNFQYVALTAGLEIRYGKRLLHLPWHPKD